MTTDLTERGLEPLICKALTGDPCDPPSGRTVGEPLRTYGGVGWSPGNHHDYNHEYCVDLVQLCTFLDATQPTPRPRSASTRTAPPAASSMPASRARSPSAAPSTSFATAQRHFRENRFRQLRYSRDATQRSLDIGLFINGLPVFTFELKNSLE